MNTQPKLHRPEPDDALAVYVASLAEMTPAQVVEEFSRQFRLLVEPLRKAAACWAHLEGIGYDLCELRRDARAFYIPHIAAGTVRPELVAAFGGNPTLLRKLATLTPQEQSRHVAGEPVELVVPGGTAGTFDVRKLPVGELTSAQRKQVFGDRAIRSETEQIALLTPKPTTIKAGRFIKVGKVEIDRTTSEVRIVAGQRAPIDDVIGALRTAGLIS